MRLTTMTDYALRLLMYLAERPERLCTIAEIAEAHGISESHLMKVTHQLGQLGWIETLRGKGGGMRLSLLPEEIPLGTVVRSMEPDFHLVECFATGGACTLSGCCTLSGVLDDALQQFLTHLDGHTLADILPTRSAPVRAQPIIMTRPASGVRASRMADA